MSESAVEPTPKPKPKHDMPAEKTNRVFLRVEFVVYTALGALLALVAIVALAHAAIDGAIGVMHWNDNDAIFGVVDELLFVLMLIEILHTVRVSIRSGALTPEPFLVVGLIASIRRVLVITLESSNATKSGDWTPGIAGTFRASMTELAVLSVLILVMVISIFLMRRSGKSTEA
jgi:uncharacterized membrane protein (DUF373 family)